jgi:hypothetical protein
MSIENEAGLPAAGETASTESEVVNQTELNQPQGTAPEGLEGEQQVEPKAEKTFTQAEVDAVAQKVRAKERRRVEREISARQAESKPLVEPNRESFSTDGEFDSAKFDYHVKKTAEEMVQRDREKARIASQQESFSQKVDEFAEEHPDYEDVVLKNDLPINRTMAEFIMEDEVGHKVAYHLGKNPDEAAKISRLTPIKAIEALVELKRELTKKQAPSVSQAPAPISPVGSTGKSSGMPDPSNTKAYIAWANKQEFGR